MPIVWEILINTAIAIAMTFFMEFVAWFTHKYVMHGFLWILHEDHHRPHSGPFEKNDLFAIFFAVISFCLVFFGALNALWPVMSMGIGMTIYGLGYMLFHDVVFHKRMKKLFKTYPPKWPYLQRIIRAHRVHHSSTSKGEGKAFGFLYASRRYDESKSGQGDDSSE